MRILIGALVLCSAAFAQDWAARSREAEDSYTRGDLKEAIRAARLARDQAPGAAESAHSLDRLGFFEYTAGDLKNGEAHLRQALDLRKEKFGAESIEYAESANDTALLLRDSDRLPAARALAEAAVAIRLRVLGNRDLRVAESLNTLASISALLGEYDLAIAKSEEARAIHEAQPEPREFSEEYGTLCINLAGTYQRVGKYAKAEATFEAGLAVLRQKPGVHHPAYAASLVAYAYLQADLGHYSAAEKLYDESGKLVREQLGEQHPVYAAFLNNRAALYTALGNLTVAESDYRRSLELKRKIYGPDALTVGASLRNLARLVYRRNPAEGEKLFKEAVDLYAKYPKPPSFDYASVLLGLGEAQRDRGDLSSARETLERALRVSKEGLGEKHPVYAAVLGGIAEVDRSAHDYKSAERTLQQAVAIVEETHGDTHPDLARYLQRLAAVYEQAGEYASAEPLYRRSLDISDRALADMISIGSQKNKSAMVANLDDPVPALIAFQQKAGTASARALAFEAVASRKGRVLDAAHDWGRSLRENPEIRGRYAQWESLLECQASLTLALGYRDLRPAAIGACTLSGTDLEGRYERLLHDLRTNWTEARGRQGLQAVKVLMRRGDALEAEFSRDVPQFASAIRSVKLDEIRARLAPGEALIEFTSYSSARRYGAFLLTRQGDLQWRDLGPAAPIDRAVQDLIASANDWSAAAAAKETRNADRAEQTAREALGTLSEKLAPALSALLQTRDVHRVRISPDGMLQLVPFGALADGRGRFLLEHFAISYLSAGRDLVASASPAGRAGDPIFIAMSPGAGARRAETAFRADRLERLNDAETEARDVHKWIPRAQVLGEGEATEQRIKTLRHPAMLHIVGHGIVRGNEDCREAPSGAGCGLASIDPASRVMSLSAIVLEEAYGRGGVSTQDGLLTALELQTLDLQGTQMLVLSQCRMADGVPSSGEGLHGMRRAAAIAGVRTFVAPLWNVADAAEQKLMDRFYAELSAGKGRAEALRQAQLQFLHSSPTPSFLEWAPVIVSGDPSPVPRDWFAR
ncbi:MAG: CHAT domain-containing protein [Acidobacteriia bacterium]|nr:CHAT domain-containing protein [Terriglobia bacterium]